MSDYNSKHAVYAVAEVTTPTNERGHLAFRVGQPTDWNSAQDRYERLYQRASKRGLTVRHDGRKYKVKPMHLEVRSVDMHGRGLGSERHAYAFPVPYRAARVAA